MCKPCTTAGFLADHPFAFLTSTTHPGFSHAPPLAAQPTAEFVVAGVACDGAKTNRPGARFGPYAIRRASHMLGDAWHPLFDLTPVQALADVGDVPLPGTSLAAKRAALEPLAAALLARHRVLWLGGDHSITRSLVHFDAHCAIPGPITAARPLAAGPGRRRRSARASSLPGNPCRSGSDLRQGPRLASTCAAAAA
ncbi:hypothetical protein SBBP1_1090004 [Burkholderiales bacterium]|nr:hypothetical protein SBBP1_1090004 [Burkholderiales bacterium]